MKNINTKLYLDKFDIMEMFDCGADKALSIIRSIKSVSDSLKLKGKVTPRDFELWYNLPSVQRAYDRAEK